MKRGDIFNIFNHKGEFTHYAEMDNDSHLSIYTIDGTFVFSAGIHANRSNFYIHDKNKAVFAAKTLNEQKFEMWSLIEPSVLLYTAELR